MITKELIEQQLNITLDKNNFSVKKLYGGCFYFFKRELKQDHYFFLEDNKDKLFLLKHNKDNYNPSITETGKQEDSFKINVELPEEVKLQINRLSDLGGLPTINPLNKQSNDTIILILLKEIKERINIIENELKRKE